MVLSAISDQVEMTRAELLKKKVFPANESLVKVMMRRTKCRSGRRERREKTKSSVRKGEYVIK